MSFLLGAMELRVCGCGHDGRLGTGREENLHALTTLTFFSGERAPVKVFCGGFHTFVVASNGVVYGFGLNEYGQLGMSSKQPDFRLPAPVSFFGGLDLSLLALASEFDVPWLSGLSCGAGLSERDNEVRTMILEKIAGDVEVVLAISCGGYHSLVLTNKNLYACGANDKGQLGVGHFDHEYSFVAVNLPISDVRGHVIAVSGGPFHSGIIIRDGSLPTRLLARTSSNDEVGATEGEDITIVPFTVMCCGSGDFGELGRDADAWEKLHAMESRIKRHVVTANHHVDQGGSASEIADFGPTSKAQPTFKIKGVVPVKRRDAFSGETFRRVRFPFLDAYALDPTLPEIAHLALRCSLRQTSVAVDYVRGKRAPTAFTWGCFFCDKVETDESSVPRQIFFKVDGIEVPARLIHGGEEVLLSVHQDPSTGADTIVVRGKGNLGCHNTDDYCEEGRGAAGARGGAV